MKKFMKAHDSYMYDYLHTLSQSELNTIITFLLYAQNMIKTILISIILYQYKINVIKIKSVLFFLNIMNITRLLSDSFLATSITALYPIFPSAKLFLS